MGRRIIRAFEFTSLSTTGLVVAGLPEIYLHGWAFLEGGTAAGVVEFRSHHPSGNAAPTPVLPVIGDALEFSRPVADAGGDSPWFAECGIYYPGGLFIDLKTGGTAVISGSIFYS